MKTKQINVDPFVYFLQSSFSKHKKITRKENLIFTINNANYSSQYSVICYYSSCETKDQSMKIQIEKHSQNYYIKLLKLMYQI